MPWEINTQEKDRHLSLSEIQQTGSILAHSAADHVAPGDDEILRQYIGDTLARRRARLEQYGQVFIERGIDNAIQIEWVARENELSHQLQGEQ